MRKVSYENRNAINTTEAYCILVAERPIWKSLTFHHLGLILSATFGAIAVVVAFFLVMRHANHYLKPYEQKQYVSFLVLPLL